MRTRTPPLLLVACLAISTITMASCTSPGGPKFKADSATLAKASAIADIGLQAGVAFGYIKPADAALVRQIGTIILTPAPQPVLTQPVKSSGKQVVPVFNPLTYHRPKETMCEKRQKANYADNDSLGRFWSINRICQRTDECAGDTGRRRLLLGVAVIDQIAVSSRVVAEPERRFMEPHGCAV